MFLSLGMAKTLIGKTATDHICDGIFDKLHFAEFNGVLPVEKFAYIAVQVFRAHIMVHSVIAPLEQSPKASYAVGMYAVMAHIFPG